MWFANTYIKPAGCLPNGKKKDNQFEVIVLVSFARHMVIFNSVVLLREAVNTQLKKNLF